MLSFICKYFVEITPPFVPLSVEGVEATLELSAMIVYPIKSCGAFDITGPWEIGNHGLLYDREWMVVNPAGAGLNQKSVMYFNFMGRGRRIYIS